MDEEMAKVILEHIKNHMSEEQWSCQQVVDWYVELRDEIEEESELAEAKRAATECVRHLASIEPQLFVPNLSLIHI